MIGRDRQVGVAAALLAGLDLQIDDLALVDLQLGAGRQVEPERQLHQRDRRAGVAGDADVDQHDELAGLGQHRGFLDRAFQRRIAADGAAARHPAGCGRLPASAAGGAAGAGAGGVRRAAARRAFLGRLGQRRAQASRAKTATRTTSGMVLIDDHVVRLAG